MLFSNIKRVIIVNSFNESMFTIWLFWSFRWSRFINLANEDTLTILLSFRSRSSSETKFLNASMLLSWLKGAKSIFSFVSFSTPFKLFIWLLCKWSYIILVMFCKARILSNRLNSKWTSNKFFKLPNGCIDLIWLDTKRMIDNLVKFLSGSIDSIKL